jgi:hypothetical protein
VTAENGSIIPRPKGKGALAHAGRRIEASAGCARITGINVFATGIGVKLKTVASIDVLTPGICTTVMDVLATRISVELTT